MEIFSLYSFSMPEINVFIVYSSISSNPEKDLTDEMYEKASMHEEKGWYLLVKISGFLIIQNLDLNLRVFHNPLTAMWCGIR